VENDAEEKEQQLDELIPIQPDEKREQDEYLRERDEALAEAERLFGLASTAMRERDDARSEAILAHRLADTQLAEAGEELTRERLLCA
jgi:hypothetical protein